MYILVNVIASHSTNRVHIQIASVGFVLIWKTIRMCGPHVSFGIYPHQASAVMYSMRSRKYDVAGAASTSPSLNASSYSAYWTVRGELPSVFRSFLKMADVWKSNLMTKELHYFPCLTPLPNFSVTNLNKYTDLLEKWKNEFEIKRFSGLPLWSKW